MKLNIDIEHKALSYYEFEKLTTFFPFLSNKTKFLDIHSIEKEKEFFMHLNKNFKMLNRPLGGELKFQKTFLNRK